MMDSGEYEYVICGGGQVGCVLASRLSQQGCSVALLEGGSENYSPQIMSPVAAPQLHNTPVEYNFMCTKQPGLDNRAIPTFAGRILSGSSAVNYGLWTRGHSVDYDCWAELVGDDRWSYKRLLKYFKRSESHHDPKGDPEQHGFNGPIQTTAGARRYPLGDTVFTALIKSGIPWNSDANGGNPLGVGAFTENWKDAQRQPAGKAYDLSKAKVFTESLVSRIIIDPETKTATRVELIDGRVFKATKEIIISCGAIKTPQLLMLSGIGPAAHLTSLGIPVIADLPVGEGLHDHLSTTMFWKLKSPELGLALGSPLFNKPEFAHGNPTQYIVTLSMPKEEIQKVIQKDNTDPNDRHISEPRAHTELMVPYAPVAGSGSAFRVPFDGNHIATPVILLLPTSRGTVTLADRNPDSDPIIDPHYLETESDKAAIRTGLRQAMSVMETTEGRTISDGETPPPGFPALDSNCSDEDLNTRMRIVGSSFIQLGGTAAMGTVVDTECRVKGVKGLRVCDGSVLPLPIAGHYQAPLYGFAEAVADMLLGVE